jgi:translation initiation factor 4G
MSICKEKPASLPPLDAIGIEPLDHSSLHLMRGGSGRHRTSSAALPPARQASIGLGFSPSTMGKGVPNSFNPMGNFGTGGPSKLSSEDRFAASSRAASVSGAAGMQFQRPMALTRTASTGPTATRERTRSKRGEKRDPNKLGNTAQHQVSNAALHNQQMSFEPVVPLQATANRWDRKTFQVQADGDSPEMVERKVKGLLNKLTMEKFDSISDQIISWANKSENEKDGRTLIQVIKLVFEKATDEATWSEMYARLGRKMMEQISPKVQDDGIKNNEGKPITGGQLFRKYLLNRCQEDFERGWVAKEATAAAAATKAMEDEAVKAANEKKGDQKEETALYSEEYYAAQKAKRRGLGLIKFIGELFKLQMLTERIMHECVKKLLGNVDNPEEEEIESLCKLLTTVGNSLDTQKARAHMDVYFSRMKELTKSPHVTPRMQFMLQVCAFLFFFSVLV